MKRYFFKFIGWIIKLFNGGKLPNSITKSAPVGYKNLHSKTEPLKLKRPMSFKEWKLFKKAHATPRYKTPCMLCREDMYVSRGQIAYFHKHCRTRGREIFSKEVFRLKAQ